MIRIVLAFALAALLLMPSSRASAADGFGMLNKDFARMTRTHPPKVWLRGTRISIRAGGQTAALKDVAIRIRSLAESEILGGDPRLRPDNDRPETVVEINVVQSEGKETWENRTVKKQRRIGEDAEGKDRYQEYEEGVRFKIVSFRYSAAYKVRDVRSGTGLDADTISSTFREEFLEGLNAPEIATLEADAVKKTVATIATRITPSKEEIGALIPRGSLKEVANLAQAGLWNKYLELLESLPPRPKPKDESYRQYGIGLAYEALGYTAETSADTLRYLQQASVHYNQALDMNPGEEYFSLPYKRRSFNLPLLSQKPGLVIRDEFAPPLERVKGALVDYQRVMEFEGEGAAAAGAKVLPVSSPSPAAAAGRTSAEGSASDALTNIGVIEMVKAGLAEDIILTAIDGAEQIGFDISPRGLIELGRAKVSKTIIQRIQARAANP